MTKKEAIEYAIQKSEQFPQIIFFIIIDLLDDNYVVYDTTNCIEFSPENDKIHAVAFGGDYYNLTKYRYNRG